MKFVQPYCDTLNRSYPSILSGQIGRHSVGIFWLRRILSSPTLPKGCCEKSALDLAAYVAQNDYNYRILLYLPFELYRKAAHELRDVVRTGWEKISHQADVRENFNQGDVLEPENRVVNLNDPTDFGDGFRRVVKVAHLLPWLVKYGYFSVQEVVQMVEDRRGDELFASSVLDALPVMKQFEVFGAGEYDRLKDALRHILPRRRIELRAAVVSSPAREAWLLELRQHAPVSFRNLTGPMMLNFDEKLTKGFVAQPGEILRFGGSQLKGYGRLDSDIDVWPIEIGAPAVPDPRNVHIVFDTVWAGESLPVIEKEQSRHAVAYMRLPPDSPERRQCLEKFEQDHLQYRLMHKGFPYALNDISFETEQFPTIDGASAFYDDRYRAVASELFLLYVFLPQM